MTVGSSVNLKSLPSHIINDKSAQYVSASHDEFQRYAPSIIGKRKKQNLESHRTGELSLYDITPSSYLSCTKRKPPVGSLEERDS